MEHVERHSRRNGCAALKTKRFFTLIAIPFMLALMIYHFFCCSSHCNDKKASSTWDNKSERMEARKSVSWNVLDEQAHTCPAKGQIQLIVRTNNGIEWKKQVQLLSLTHSLALFSLSKFVSEHIVRMCVLVFFSFCPFGCRLHLTMVVQSTNCHNFYF